MSRLYEIKLKKFEDCNKQLENLIADCDAISSDISAKSNRAERQQLERQQAIYQEEMEQVAQRCDHLTLELNALQAEEEALQRLITFVTSISLDKVINAYRFCLPEGRIPSGDATREILVRRLAEMPEAEDELKPLLRFVNFMIREPSLTSAQREDLEVWAKAQGLPSEMLNSEQRQHQTDTVETCLMVKVKPRSLNDPSKGYLLNATLFTDSDPFEPVEPFESIATPVKVPASTNPNSPIHSQDELGMVLGKLINICGAEHEIALTDLTVQLFLPIELMSWPIEHGQLPRGKQCCGQRCKAVLVRSYERHFLEFYQSAKGDWKKYWKRFLEFPEATCTETLTLLNPVIGRTKVQANKPKVIGCRFIEHHEQQQQEDFWDNLLNQGLPIAFWIRHLGMTSKEANKVMGSVTRSCAIKKLPESLMKKRQKLLSEPSENERLRKAPFCLLWDNPFRPFPSINYQSE